MIDKMASTPGMARNVLSVIRILMALAMEDGLRTDNSALGIKRPKLSLDGWHTWSEGEIAQYESCHPVGSEARLALALALHTGQRRSDLIRMGKQHGRDGKLIVRQQKTGTPLEIPIHRELRAIFDVTPSDHLTFLVTKDGKPYSPNGFTHRFKLWARQAGLRGCPLHGLRKAACRRLAEAGCGAPEIMAISGHKTLSEVERYIKAAEQKLMAERAILRTESYPRGRQVLPTEKKA
jgi:integrase